MYVYIHILRTLETCAKNSICRDGWIYTLATVGSRLLPHARNSSHPQLSCSIQESISRAQYGVATISRLLKMIGLFCKRAL